MTQPDAVDTILQLKRENDRIRTELEQLRSKLSTVSVEETDVGLPIAATCAVSPSQPSAAGQPHSLTKPQVERYSRHLLLPSFGIGAQDRLSKASILIVGCGGLGSPAALYLASMGVGRLGLVDHDSVDLSNLHRQIAHTEHRVGQHKGISAAEACRARNSSVDVKVHLMGLDNFNAVKIISQYDVVIDASDNAPTRYLISDACVVTGRPLVSGAAVGTDGQLTVYCAGDETPCYRCLFPESPAPENCSRCTDAGVLGVVPGVIGTLQALEAVKLVTGVGEPLRRRLLVFDGLSCSFMTVKLRARRPECIACGTTPALTTSNLSSFNYIAFTGQAATDGSPPPLQLLGPEDRIQAIELLARLQLAYQQQALNLSSMINTNTTHTNGHAHTHSNGNHMPDVAMDDASMELHDSNGTRSTISINGAGIHAGTGAGTDVVNITTGTSPYHGLVLLDVRPTHQYQIMSLPGAHSVPFTKFDQHIDQIKELCGVTVEGLPHASPPEVYVICRRGNDSQRAVARLKAAGVTWAKDVIGGYTAWAEEVDANMPVL